MTVNITIVKTGLPKGVLCRVELRQPDEYDLVIAKKSDGLIGFKSQKKISHLRRLDGRIVEKSTVPMNITPFKKYSGVYFVGLGWYRVGLEGYEKE